MYLKTTVPLGMFGYITEQLGIFVPTTELLVMLVYTTIPLGMHFSTTERFCVFIRTTHHENIMKNATKLEQYS